MNPTDDGDSRSLCAAAPSVLVVDADPALAGLLDEWLVGCGCFVLRQVADDTREHERFDLIVVDLPFPREGGVGRLRRLAERHPGTPVLALSPAFFSGTASQGALARRLGVAGVLPKPLTREALTAAARRLLAPSP